MKFFFFFLTIPSSILVNLSLLGFDGGAIPFYLVKIRFYSHMCNRVLPSSAENNSIDWRLGLLDPVVENKKHALKELF